MRRLFLLLTFSSLMGCTISEDGVDTASIDADVCEESGGEFCSTDGTSVDLELIIKTSDPIITDSANGDCDANVTRDINGVKGDINGISQQFCFDISGLCNEAGLDLASIVVRSSLDSFGSSTTIGSCQRGKFHVQVRMSLDTGVFGDNSDQGDLCRLHTLELELVGKKADGSEITQSSKSKKRIGFRVSNHVKCT